MVEVPVDLPQHDRAEDDPEKNKEGDIDRRKESGPNPGRQTGTIHGSDTFAGKPGSRNPKGDSSEGVPQPVPWPEPTVRWE